MADEKIICERQDLVDIANVVRAKSKTTAQMTLKQIATVANSISTGIDTSDATATANAIFKDETAYVDGEKVTGIFTIDSELTAQDNLISQIRTALNGKAIDAPSEDLAAVLAEQAQLIATLQETLNNKANASGGVEAWTGTVHGAQMTLGDIPDNLYFYTDAQLINRSIRLAKGESATITIAAHTPIFGTSGYTLNDEPEVNTEAYVNSAYHSFLVFIPTSNNFEYEI